MPRSHPALAMLSFDSAGQRARPHCVLSLATACASRSATCHIDTDAMDVDIEPPFALVRSSTADLPPWKVIDAVPFPTDSEKSPRKHALLRSSIPLVTSILSNRKDRDPSELLFPSSENQPPRKRTRTSALLQPPIKPQRSARNFPSRLPRSASSLLLSGHAKSSVPPKSVEEPFVYAFPTSMSCSTVTPQSPVLNLISNLITPISLHYSNLPNLPPSIPSPRRRKPFSGGTVLLRSVYKTVVHGLTVKYPAQDFQGSSPKSPFDIQDALLADKLRCHLTLLGEDINMIVFEIEKMENRQSESLSPTTPSPPENVHPVLSYERLVSFVLLQKGTEGRKMSRKGVAPRKPSKLAESCIIGSA